MYGKDILCGISKGTFEIPHKISYPYIERCGFYSQVKIEELLNLRAHKCFWSAHCSSPSHPMKIHSAVRYGVLTHWYEDVIKWKHFPRHWPFVRGIHRSLVNSTHKGQWRGVLTFSVLCTWTNGWANNRDASDLRRHRAHDDVTVMRPRQNERYFADDKFKCVFLNENVWISIKISLKFVPTCPVNNIPALV